MKKWNKYWLDPALRGVNYFSIDRDFNEHSEGMGGYEANESYCSADDFFHRYLPRNGGRHDCYDFFLQKSLSKGQNILSIASGRAANEARLLQQGHTITCSDLEVPPAYEETKRLFPGLIYDRLDILKESPRQTYDAIVSLSLIYLFDNNELERVFRHIAAGLRNGGLFILDASTAPDNGLATIFHDFYLRFEIIVRRWLALLKTGKLPGLVIEHHGYRRNDADILALAKQCGFLLMSRENSGFLMEFRRSALLNRILKPGGWITGFFERLGRSIPYVRMFCFRKEPAPS